MVPLVAGFALFWVGTMLVREFLRANPAAVARGMRKGGGAALVLVALLMLLRGEIGAALAFAGFGVFLFTGRRASLFGGFAGRAAAGGTPRSARRRRVSRVRSATIEMELDQASGALSGTVLAGPFEGWSLDRLDREKLSALHRFCRTADDEGARLLEAYLDRRFPGWRGAAEHEGDARRREGAPSRRTGAMSEDEARELLGLAKGASREEVARAHRNAMKTAHPDHGGSTDLAARVNEAKDVLMRRHQ